MLPTRVPGAQLLLISRSLSDWVPGTRAEVSLRSSVAIGLDLAPSPRAERLAPRVVQPAPQPLCVAKSEFRRVVVDSVRYTGAVSHPSYQWIRSSAELAELEPAAAAAEWIALDTESNSMFVYRERVCLIQLSLAGTLYLIDPFLLDAGTDGLAPLAAAIANPEQPLYLHGGEYDVACLKRDYGLQFGGLFDTQQAASLVGLERTGYARLVEAFCDVSLPKGHTHYNWGKRPIDDKAIRYALDDVVYLPTVVTALQAVVADADLTDEVRVACEIVSAAPAHQPGYDPGRVWRLKGISSLGKGQLAVATALHRLRDELAAKADQPPARMIANPVIVNLARQAPTEADQLARCGLRGKPAARYGDRILAAIVEARANPPEVPERPIRPKKLPDVRDREDVLKNWRRGEAEQRGVSIQAVLPTRAIEQLAASPDQALEDIPWLGPARIARYGDTLRSLVAAS